MGRLARIERRRAHFIEEKRFAALDQVIRSAGTLAYTRPAHLEKTTFPPAAESLVVDGDRLVVGGGTAPRVVMLDQQPEIQSLVDTIRGVLSGDLTALRRNYRVEASGTARNWQVTLRPIGPALRQLVREVHVAGDTDVRVIETVQPNGDTDRLTITPDP